MKCENADTVGAPIAVDDDGDEDDNDAGDDMVKADVEFDDISNEDEMAASCLLEGNIIWVMFFTFVGIVFGVVPPDDPDVVDVAIPVVSNVFDDVTEKRRVKAGY